MQLKCHSPRYTPLQYSTPSRSILIGRCQRILSSHTHWQSPLPPDHPQHEPSIPSTHNPNHTTQSLLHAKMRRSLLSRSRSTVHPQLHIVINHWIPTQLHSHRLQQSPPNRLSCTLQRSTFKSIALHQVPQPYILLTHQHST